MGEEELRLISTRDLNILAKNKGLRREEVKEVKDYSIPLSKKNLGLTEEELRLISTRDLNILAKNKGLRREEVKEVKEARRRLKNDEMRSILSIRLKNI